MEIVRQVCIQVPCIGYKSITKILFFSSYTTFKEIKTTRKRVIRGKKTKTYSGTEADGGFLLTT